jgi:hypothetical protein
MRACKNRTWPAVARGAARRLVTLLPAATSALPCEHALRGAGEVAVDCVSRAVLLLRATGQFLAGKPSAAVGPVARGP